MENEHAKNILRNGTPGEAIRLMTKSYLRLKLGPQNLPDDLICKALVNERVDMYKRLGAKISRHLIKATKKSIDECFASGTNAGFNSELNVNIESL